MPVRVLVRLARDRGLEVAGGVAERHVRGGVAYLLEVVEMTMGMTGLTFGGLAKIAGDLWIPFDIGDLGEIQIAAVRLGFAGECGLEIFVGLRSLELGHVGAPSNGRTVSSQRRMSSTPGPRWPRERGLHAGRRT
jgi:hypothetical protein